MVHQACGLRHFPSASFYPSTLLTAGFNRMSFQEVPRCPVIALVLLKHQRLSLIAAVGAWPA
eukprot:scaffold87397_cov22-Tisochrysis_lutea.AAC.2